MNSVDRAVSNCTQLLKYHVSPFRCYYFNPRKYTPVELMKWSQKYILNRMYVTLLRAAKITGYELVPAELLMNHAARDGYSERLIKVGRKAFYLLKTEEMHTGLNKRLNEFKQKMAEFDSNSITISDKEFGCV